MKKIMIFMGMILALGFCLISIHNVKTRSRNISENVSTEEKDLSQDQTQESVDLTQTLDQFQAPYDGTEDLPLLKALQEVATLMVENEFTYNTSKIGKTLEKALEGNRHGDCAHLITWAMQSLGYLEEGQNFYSKKKGVLSCKSDGDTYEKLTENFEIIEITPTKGSNQETLKSILKLGDICCYSLHMNVVAGLDKKGNIIYYDGGLTPVEGHRSTGRFTEKLTRPYARPHMKNTLYTIIRKRTD